MAALVVCRSVQNKFDFQLTGWAARVVFSCRNPAGIVVGRRSLHTPEIAESVLRQLCAGPRLPEVCGEAGMPSASTVQGWVKHDCHGFAAAYARARQTARVRLGRVAPLWSAELAERILQQLRRGRTLIAICRDPGMPPYGTVRGWVNDDRHHFAALYRQALRAGDARWTRPVRYAPELAEAILDELCAGRSLAAVCRDPGMPTETTVRLWVSEDRNGFAAPYRRARQLGCDALADEIIKIIDSRDDWIEYRTEDGRIERVLDDQRIPRRLLAVKARRWLLLRMLPVARREWG
jgi:hypothetical protein